ncbi:hypothetical protein [Gordonia soli]|uniref:Uncharacterized protein n=1 Tax=Gordonia soli NBRC 108243 TaxID=1223545 RepID=M0QFC6_9ACTN|nr:hypothetical protein [Gordonia soli]GAC67006.1 hypothetical protein GS4_05_02190 [Gordonia soli NBRC 108243]
MIAVIVIVVTIVVAVFVLGGAAWFAYDSDKRVKTFARSTELVPGKEGRAPAEWTTASSREALLHRRIRYAIADVHGNPAIEHFPDVLTARDDLDDAVFAIDDRLIAASELPDEGKTAALDGIEAAVEVLEALPTKLWEAPTEQQQSDLGATAGSLRKAAAA